MDFKSKITSHKDGYEINEYDASHLLLYKINFYLNSKMIIQVNSSYK